MADHPDVYADGLTINVNPLGITVTFTRLNPATPGVHESVERVIACRVRMARPIAEGLRDTLAKALQAKAKQGEQTLSH